jgi:hypothetical protein
MDRVLSEARQYFGKERGFEAVDELALHGQLYKRAQVVSGDYLQSDQCVQQATRQLCETLYTQLCLTVAFENLLMPRKIRIDVMSLQQCDAVAVVVAFRTLPLPAAAL